MQGDELVPGGKNVLARRAGRGPPYRLGRDRPLNPLKNLRKSARRKVGTQLFRQLSRFRMMVMVVGKGGDDAGAQFVRLRVREFQRRHLLEMVVQEPGMMDQGLQDQRLAAGERRRIPASARFRS